MSTRSAGGEPEYVFNEAAQNRRVHYGDAERAALADAAMVVVSCFPFDDAEQTAAAFRDGWFRTGDVAYRDANGYYYFVGRKK
ncbi:hypothetical protein, partial [Streptomyces brasiliscabiei]|uniref:hypothetical protein n=1 Tax=Streptomyces brasiliscabiei TaxID=2736302 RepID=UPI00301576E3